MYQSKFNFLLGSLSILVGSVFTQEDYDRIAKNAKEYTGTKNSRGIVKDIDIDMGVLGDKTVTVEFLYFPAERQTYDEPGCDAEYEILSITHDGEDISFMFDDDSLITGKLEEERDCGEDY